MDRKLVSNIHIYIFVFFLSVYFLTSQGTIQSSDGTSMFLVTESMVENRTFSIETDRIDLVKKSKVNENFYSKYGVGQSIFVVPLFITGKFISSAINIPVEFLTKFMVSLYNSLITAATCIVMYLFCRKLDYKADTSIFIVFVYGLSTIAWHYAQTFMSEPTTTLFILCAVYYIYNYENYSKNNILLAGLCAGLAILTRVASVIVIPCILFYIIHSFWCRHNNLKDKEILKNITLFLSPVLIFTFIFFLYNYSRFGNIFDTGYSGEMFSTDIFTGIYGLLFSTGKGLFAYNPILILSIVGFYFFYKERKKEAILFLLIIFVHLALYSKWSSWSAGMSWGGRFLLVIIPYLVITLKYAIESKNNLLRKTLIFLTIVGILIQFSSLFVSTSRQYYDLRSRYHDNYMDKLIFSPKHFPVIYQWKTIPKVFKNIFNQDYVDELIDQAISGKNFTNSDDNYILKKALTINVPNFWWVYAWLYGIPKWIILSSLAIVLSVIIITGKKILQFSV